MVRIVSDTSTLYSTAQAREAGFAVSPLSVTIAARGLSPWSGSRDCGHRWR